MRTAILDVGSNSAHLKIVELDPGAPLRTVLSAKRPTRLAEAITRDGRIAPEAVDRLVGAVTAAHEIARTEGATELIAFATSAVRDAAGRCAIIERIAEQSGVRLGFLSGRDEARLTFLAAREWYGYSAGPLLLADIGGGSLEVAFGTGTEPDIALSLPLGAGLLTRSHLPGDPPRRKHVEKLRAHIAAQLAAHLPAFDAPPGTGPVHPVATSKTFTQLARLTRGTKSGGSCTLDRKRLQRQIPTLAKLSASERAELRGVSATRARQILAGAIIAHDLMQALKVRRLEICPWALREGIALRHLQQLHTADRLSDDIEHLKQPIVREHRGMRLLPPLGA